MRKAKRLDIGEYAIVSDFDGTIVLEDSNDLLFQTCGTAENVEIEAAYSAGEAGNQETMTRHFDVLRMSPGAYDAFLDCNIHIDPGFDAFLQRVRVEGLPFFIVSAGFRQGIRRVLGEARLQGVQVFANDLVGEAYVMPSFALKEAACTEAIGPCGNCKKACIDAIREQTGQKILYIGDGLTDRCVVQKADWLFAKDALAEYCEAHHLPYTPFVSFFDVVRHLWPEER